MTDEQLKDLESKASAASIEWKISTLMDKGKAFTEAANPEAILSMVTRIRELERMCLRAEYLVGRFAFEIRFDEASAGERNSCLHWLKGYAKLNKEASAG